MLQPRKSTSLKDYLLIAEDIKDYCRQCINQYGNLTLTYIQPKYVTKNALSRNTTLVLKQWQKLGYHIVIFFENNIAQVSQS